MNTQSQSQIVIVVATERPGCMRQFLCSHRDGWDNMLTTTTPMYYARFNTRPEALSVLAQFQTNFPELCGLAAFDPQTWTVGETEFCSPERAAQIFASQAAILKACEDAEQRERNTEATA